MKNRLYFKLILSLLFIVLMASASLAQIPNLTLTPATQSVLIGNQGTVNIEVENVTNLLSGNITLTFDETKLAYRSSALGSFFGNGFKDALVTGGSLNIAFATTDVVKPSGSGTILTVNFERIDSGVTDICFGVTVLTNQDGIDFAHNQGGCVSFAECTGDLNGDLQVNYNDLVIFAMAYRATPGSANWNPVCDLNADGSVNYNDLVIFAMHYRDDCRPCTPPSAPTLSDPGTTLPSPATYTVSWSVVTEATSYVLQEDTSPDFSGAISYPVLSTSKEFSHTVTTTTTYYYRVASVNDCGQGGWSDVEDMIVGVVPTVTTQAATDIETNSVTANGTITSDGGSNIIEKGFEYGLTQTPTWSVKETGTDLGTGAFSNTISDLDSDTTYWVKAYAVNSEGKSTNEDWQEFHILPDIIITNSATFTCDGQQPVMSNCSVTLQ